MSQRNRGSVRKPRVWTAKAPGLGLPGRQTGVGRAAAQEVGLYKQGRAPSNRTQTPWQ